MTDTARSAALATLNQIRPNSPTLDTLIDRQIARYGLSRQRDRSFLYTLVYGVLRFRGRLDWILSQLSKQPLKKTDPAIRNVLRLGLYQIQFLDRVPNSAAVNTSVELAKASAGPWVVRYVNAVLRNAIRKDGRFKFPDPVADPVASIAARRAFPEWLIRRWLKRFGLEDTDRICHRMNQLPPLSLRCNGLKTDRSTLQRELESSGIRVERTVHAPEGLHLRGLRGQIGNLAQCRQGLFQVQDEAAQLVTLLLTPSAGMRVLDACAGLGGKSGHIAQLMGNAGQVLAVDSHLGRLRTLSATMRRMGADIVDPICSDLAAAVAIDPATVFDAIFIDVPCSSLGVLGRNPDIKWRRKAHDIDRFQARQLQLCTSLAPLVKPGGVLVYSVCSMEPEENESVVRRFISAHPHFTIENPTKNLPPAAGKLIDTDGFLRTYPHRDGTDGFFGARLRRVD